MMTRKYKANTKQSRAILVPTFPAFPTFPTVGSDSSAEEDQEHLYWDDDNNDFFDF